MKWKNLLPVCVSKFFLFRVDPFTKGIIVQESKKEVTEVVSLVKKCRTIYKVYLITVSLFKQWNIQRDKFKKF